MQGDDLTKEYQSKTNEELLRLAKKSDRLTPEASAALMNEVAKRGLQTMEAPVFASPSLSVGSSSAGSAAAPALERSTAGEANPSLGLETAKAPWRPKVAGRIAFWFGPVAGAMVVATSLRRMGHQESARKVMLLAFGVAVIEVVILLVVSDGVGTLVGLGGHIGFLLLFPPLMEKEFKQWQGAHPDAEPSSGWKAIGVGLIGTVIFGAIAFVGALALGAVFPDRF